MPTTANRGGIKYQSQKNVRRHNFNSMGIEPMGIDYCRVEDILRCRAPQLKLPHRHDYYEIIWFTECRGTHMVEFANYELQANMLFFLPKNQIHAFVSTENIKGHMLRFDESFLNFVSESDVSILKRSLFKIHASPVRYITKEHVSIFENIITLLIDEILKKKDIYHREMLCTLLNALLIESERILPALDNQIGISNKFLKKFYRFTALLEDNFHKQYTVQQYADMMHMVPKTLRNICNHVSGLSVKTIIQNRVILEAQIYLQNTDMDIQEISDKLGFEDPSYFSRYFRRATQVAPSRFRTAEGAKVP